ncbi:unnamed protein product, partial [marine sediment metagenome]
ALANRKIFEDRNVLRDEEIFCIIIWTNYFNINRGMPKFGRFISFFK